MTSKFFLRLSTAVLVLGSVISSFAQTTIRYWHSQGSTVETIQAFADDFNASQNDYRLEPEYVGNYEEAAIRLITAVSAGNAPVLFDAELSVFNRLVAEEAIMPLDSYMATVDSDLLADIYPIMLENGMVAGQRYGLPFNSSVPLLFYNSDLLEQRDVSAPTTWAEFEAVAERMTTRQTKGYISVSLPFVLEAFVNARGGSVLTAEGQPNFTSPEMVEVVSMLARMARARHSTNRNMNEIDIALIDFIRTKGSMAMATSALWPSGQEYSIAFTPRASVLPLAENGKQPITGAQLTVMAGSSEAEIAGALAFWQFLMQADTITTWATISYFTPLRRSVAQQLASQWKENDVRQHAIYMLEHDQLRIRPRSSDYATWQRYLSEAVDKAVAGRMSPEEALQEAQNRSEQ